MHLLLLPAFLFAALRAIAFFPLGALPGLVYGLERLRVLRVVVGPDEELLPIESVADAERAAFEPVDLRMRRLDRVLAEDAGIPPPLHELGGVKDAVAALKRAAKVRETDVAVAKADMDDKEGAFSRANAAFSKNASARRKKAKTEAKSAFDKAKNHHEKTRLMNEGTKRAVVRGDGLLRTIKKPRRQ